MTDEAKVILVDQIEPLIHEVRGQKIMLDSDLAALYGVGRDLDSLEPFVWFSGKEMSRFDFSIGHCEGCHRRSGCRFPRCVRSKGSMRAAANMLEAWHVARRVMICCVDSRKILRGTILRSSQRCQSDLSKCSAFLRSVRPLHRADAAPTGIFTHELIYLAFLSDSTRVATFQLGRENGEGPHDLLSQAVGLGGAHGLTHEVKKPDGWKNLGTYNRYQAEEFGRFAQKLKETPEPTGGPMD